jgi:FKBP-type peptidyl-prolyl cis-trans isomerase FkpA
MKRIFLLALCAALVLPLAAQDLPAATPADAGYALGMLMGTNIKAAGLEIGFDDYLAGLKDAMAGGETRFSPAQAQAIIQAAVSLVQAKKAEENLAAGLAFLAANKDKPGVTATASGLQYEVLTMATETCPRPRTWSP